METSGTDGGHCTVGLDLVKDAGGGDIRHAVKAQTAICGEDESHIGD